MISDIDFFIFAAVMLSMAFLSVRLRHTLYAALCQLQAVVALSGMLVGLNARFIGFALLFMSASAFVVFLLFALAVFDFDKIHADEPVRLRRVLALFFVLSAVQAVALFARTAWPVLPVLPPHDFSVSVMGTVLYSDYAPCVLVFGVLLLSALVGITALMTGRMAEPDRDPPPGEKSAEAEIRHIPLKEDMS